MADEIKFNKKQTQKEIDIAVKVYRESLEKTYLEKEKNFFGSGMHQLTKFFIGKVDIQRLQNGNLKISGTLPKLMFKDDCIGLPRSIHDWKILPMVFTFFQEDIADKPKEDQ